MQQSAAQLECFDACDGAAAALPVCPQGRGPSGSTLAERGRPGAWPALCRANATEHPCAQAEAAEREGKQTVLINPILKDVPSSSGVMGVRGRQERLAFENSFETAYHFRLLYWAGSMYPIIGCIRHSHGGPWEVRRYMTDA